MTSENLVECLVMCGTVVRVDTRYLFNRANFDIQNRFFESDNFGRIFSARNAREMQFGLRYTF